MLSWSSSAPSWIDTPLPKDTKPTTTMSLLLKHGFVEGGREFVRRLCTRDDDPWGLTFDGLSQMFPELPVEVTELPGLLVDAPSGGEVPSALQPAMDHALRQRDVVEEVLGKADIAVDSGLVVAHIDDAKRVPLSRYSLTLGRRHPGSLVVIVHRRQRLYCGRSSQQPGVNLIEHFRDRDLDPKGHPYVCTVDVRDDDIEDEVAAIKVAMGGAG